MDVKPELRWGNDRPISRFVNFIKELPIVVKIVGWQILDH
jgi:hypothetical protein